MNMTVVLKAGSRPAGNRLAFCITVDVALGSPNLNGYPPSPVQERG
jgi:hypothetical protein